MKNLFMTSPLVPEESYLYIVDLVGGPGQDLCDNKLFNCIEEAASYFLEVDLGEYEEANIELYDDDDGGAYEAFFGEPDLSRPFEEHSYLFNNCYYSSRHPNVVLFLDDDGALEEATRYKDGLYL
tara:strand:+ start:1107 stop:1481 length:375 start_codon:yes stop_codon:yes gene_type:complete